MKKTAILLMLITILSKIFGFLRDITLSYFYGASGISDAYLIAITIPTVIFTFIGIGISTGYIPMYSKIEKRDGTKTANIYTNNLINILIVLSAIITLFGLLFTEQTVKLFAPGFEEEIFKLAVQFTRISLFGIFFTALVYVFSGFLQLKGNYVIPAFIGFPLNIFTILFTVLSAKGNVLLLAVGSLIAAASQLLLLIPFAYKKGYIYKPVLNLKDENIKKMAYIALPVIIGVSVNQINILVDRTFASQITVGGISALNYAERLNDFVQGIFVLPIVTVMYPMISKMAAENNIAGLKKSVSEAISGINLLVIPAAFGAMLFAEPVVELLFGRGAFDAQAVTVTSCALFFYSIGMIGYGLREVLSRAFYSLHDTKTPMINAAVAMGMNIILNIILSKFLGVGGLALATSISAIFCTILLFISLRKKIGPFGMRSIMISFFKIISASVVTGLIAKWSFDAVTITFGQNLSLLISIGIGALTYLAIIYFMKIDDVDSMVNAIKGKFQKIFL